MSENEPRAKMQPIDYAVLFGGPIVFILIALLGIRILLGPAPEPNPIQMLREGRVTIGMRGSDALRMLGRITERIEHEDGSISIRYTRTDWSDVARDRAANLAQDEAWVEIGPDGLVRNIRFERIPVPAPSEGT